MTRINRISGSRPPAPISRQPEQEPAYLQEEQRQRARLEEQNERSKQQHKQPSPEEQAQRKAEKVADGAVRGALVKTSDPTSVPVISIADLFHKAKTAGLHQDEITRIQVYLKKLSAQDRTHELRFLQDKILPARNVNQCLRAYADLAALSVQHTERIDDNVIRALTGSVAERNTGKNRIPSSICSRQEALDAALVLTMLPDADLQRMKELLNQVGEKLGEKNREADPETERALILKSLGLRSRLFTQPDPTARMREIAGVPTKPVIEVAQFAMRIRGLAGRDLLDYARTTMPLHPSPNTLSVNPGTAAKSPQQYLREGFYGDDGLFRDLLIGVFALSAAEQIVSDGIQSSFLKTIVQQLTHIAMEYEQRYGDTLGFKLDPPAVTVIAMILESEEVSDSPVLWELMDAANQWIRDLKGLAGLILHLDAITEYM